MLNFAIGPVQMDERIRSLGAGQIPYFRTDEFSRVMRENEEMMRQCADAGEGSRVLFLTGSGTAAMEAVVWNVFTPEDKLLVVNGGSFGARFLRLCEIHRIPHDEIRLESGKTLTKEELAPFAGKGYTGFLVNSLETSTGVSYDMDLIGKFCRDNGCLLACDAVSSFLADPLSMDGQGIDVMLTGSQKNLSLPPGISIIVLNPRAVRRVETNAVETMYFDLKDYLRDGLRGQTPYTPAVGILLQLNARLKELVKMGVKKEICRVSGLAAHFREGIREMPFAITSNRLSNAMTPLHPLHVPAFQIFLTLKDEYGIYVCPNGGSLADELFRVGHIGCLTDKDNQILLAAFRDMQERGLL